MPRQNKIVIRNGTTTPSAADFDTAEPAWDKTAGKLYIKDGAGSMKEVGGGGVIYELIEDGASKAAGSYINISGYKAVYMICHNDPATNSSNRNGPYLSTSNTSNTGVSTRNGRWWRRDSSNTYDTASVSLSTNSLYYGSNTTSDVNKVWKLSLQGLNTSNVFIETYSENNGASPTYAETAWSGVTTSGSSTWYIYIHQALLEYQIYGVK